MEEVISVSERRLYHCIHVGSSVSVSIHLLTGVTTCIDSTPLTITHSMILTPLPSAAKHQKGWLERSHFNIFPGTLSLFFDLWEG
ncbi:hypothetical protein Bca101_012906 [Brassica carinata]